MNSFCGNDIVFNIFFATFSRWSSSLMWWAFITTVNIMTASVFFFFFYFLFIQWLRHGMSDRSTYGLFPSLSWLPVIQFPFLLTISIKVDDHKVWLLKATVSFIPWVILKSWLTKFLMVDLTYNASLSVGSYQANEIEVLYNNLNTFFPVVVGKGDCLRKLRIQCVYDKHKRSQSECLSKIRLPSPWWWIVFLFHFLFQFHVSMRV